VSLVNRINDLPVVPLDRVPLGFLLAPKKIFKSKVTILVMHYNTIKDGVKEFKIKK